MRRVIRTISIGLLIALAALVVIVQVVLWSPLPKRIVIQQIQAQLGLRISAADLSTGWFGNSQLSRVSLGLPLSRDDFLKVKSLKIKHSNLIMLALGHVAVESVEIDDPQIAVTQDAGGQWNLQQVITLLGRLGGTQSSQTQTTDTGIPMLPIIKLLNGSVQITDNQNRSATLAPLNINGQPNGALVWQYNLTIADSITATGKLAPGGNWQHQIVLDIHNLDPLLKNWGVPTTYAAAVKAHWDGQFSGGKLTGTFVLDHTTAAKLPTLGDVTLTGSIDAESDGPILTLHPHRVDLKTSLVTLPEARIDGGSILSDATGLHAQGVKLQALAGLTNIDASFDPRTTAADLRASWSGLSVANRTSQDGSLTATLRETFAGQPIIMAELIDNGTIGDPAVAANRWNARLKLTGQGSSWQNIDWLLTAPHLQYITGGQVVDLSNTSAHISQHLPIVELTSLSLPQNTSATGTTPASLSSDGRVDFKSMQWNFNLAGGFNTAFQHTPVPVTFVLNAKGNNARYELPSLVLNIADLTLTFDGSYDTSLPTPVDLHVKLAQTPRIAPDAPIQGEVAGEFKIVGALFKEKNHFRPYLTTTGDLKSNDLVVFNRPVGDIEIKLTGNTETPNLATGEAGPSITQIQANSFYLFQAPWDLSIAYPNVDGNLEAVLQAHHVSLENIGKFAEVDGISGEVVEATLTAVMPTPELSRVYAHSEFRLTDVNADGVTADTVDGKLTLRDGLLKLAPLVAKSGGGTVTTTASLDLRNPRQLVTETTVDHWPSALSTTVSAVSSAQANLKLDIKAKPLGGEGTLSGFTDLMMGGTRLAHADVGAGITNRTINLDKFNGKILNSPFDATAQIDLDKPLAASGRLAWQNVDGLAIATAFPSLEGFGGQYSGTITLAPARDPRPLEPVRVDINVAATNGHFRSMQIGGDGLLAIHAVGYLNTDRAVLDHSDIYLAGGVMHAWARARVRPTTGFATQLAVDFRQFQLDQLAHIDEKLTKPIPGVLSGQIGLIRTGSHASQVLANAHVNLDQADLGNFGPIASLYNLMNVGSKPNSGSGEVDLAFEQNVVRVTNFRYFNQGVEARGLASIGPLNYDQPMDSGLGGQVVGTARPLKDTKLPFLADFDSVFAAFQGGLTTINITGSLNQPAYSQGLVSDITRTMRQLLVGDAENKNGKESAQ
jgi:hypothetical protein